MKTESIILKPNKDKAIRNHHHWIFSGAVASMPPSFQDGDFLPVHASNGDFLGFGYFNRESKIIGRMVSFDSTPPLESLSKKLLTAIQLRNKLFDFNQTNAFRLVNAEGDGIPGLVIDVYHNVLVVQISTLGIERIKTWLIAFLVEHYKPKAIYEKSTQAVRKEEGMTESKGFIYGQAESEVRFKENGLAFTASLPESQKTGFFLDHREMRQWVRELSKGKRVLNAFSYTGGFTVAALAGGALNADSVDISAEAIGRTKKHVSLNGFPEEKQRYYCEDVFKFLRDQELVAYDLVVLDPPAFAKRQKDIIPACRGYKDINRLAMFKMKPGSLLLTSSCSHYIDDLLFQKVLFQAAIEARREVKIIGTHRQGSDHPLNLYHPESHYLKSFLLYIE